VIVPDIQLVDMVITIEPILPWVCRAMPKSRMKRGGKHPWIMVLLISFQDWNWS